MMNFLSKLKQKSSFLTTVILGIGIALLFVSDIGSWVINGFNPGGLIVILIYIVAYVLILFGSKMGLDKFVKLPLIGLGCFLIITNGVNGFSTLSLLKYAQNNGVAAADYVFNALLAIACLALGFFLAKDYLFQSKTVVRDSAICVISILGIIFIQLILIIVMVAQQNASWPNIISYAASLCMISALYICYLSLKDVDVSTPIKEKKEKEDDPKVVDVEPTNEKKED